MKCSYRTRNGRMLFEVTGDTQKALFREIAALQAVFEVDETCGLCQSPAINFEARTVDGNEYFTLRCQNCGAQLNFGQHKQGGTLFPKTAKTPDRGWHIYASPDQWGPTSSSLEGVASVKRIPR
jgi:hypothetical protein